MTLPLSHTLHTCALSLVKNFEAFDQLLELLIEDEEAMALAE